MNKVRSDGAADAFFSAPSFSDVEDVGVAVLALLAVVLVVFVAIPLLLFGIELILLGLVIAAGVFGRALLGRPWIVQAVTTDSEASPLSWRVVGWRRSGRLIEEVAIALSSGLDPAPAEDCERMLVS